MLLDLVISEYGWAQQQPRLQNSCKLYEQGTDFYAIARESGTQRYDLPIFTTYPKIIQLERHPKTVVRQDFAELPGVFLLHNVLTPQECEQIIAASEAMGYTEDAPVSLGRHIRQNENCVWIADNELLDTIYGRFSYLLTTEPDGSAPLGLNARWRLYKYNLYDIFRPHIDGSWPGSGIDPKTGKLVQDIFGDRWSRFTWVLYLNDDFEGGATHFFVPLAGGSQYLKREILAQQGAVLCFYHGKHNLSYLHEGALVTFGTKYILRSDVLYSS